jgi:uncharacterized protein YndB with AHSA1/START domain
MERTAEQVVYERELAIAATPETVWGLLADPAKIVRWMGVNAELDARPGGAYRIEVLPGSVASGEVVELDPPRRLVLSWGWEPGVDGPNPVPPGSSTVEFELVPTAAGTTLRFTHRGLPDAAAAERHAQGWDHYLDRLTVAAPGGNPGSDPWLNNKQ